MRVADSVFEGMTWDGTGPRWVLAQRWASVLFEANCAVRFRNFIAWHQKQSTRQIRLIKMAMREVPEE
jgi:hypothetical protein